MALRKVRTDEEDPAQDAVMKQFQRKMGELTLNNFTEDGVSKESVSIDMPLESSPVHKELLNGNTNTALIKKRQSPSVGSDKNSPGPPIGTFVFREIACSEDVDYIRAINEECFPIKYDDSFYREVANGWSGNVRLDTIVGALPSRLGDLETGGDDKLGKVVGCITGQNRPLNERGTDGPCSDLADDFRSGSCYYILTLAVTEQQRRFGIATQLLNRLVEIAENIDGCMIVYLHVIHYNERAMRFYEKNGFRKRRRIKQFYSIGGKPYDAFLYVKYLHNAHPPQLKPSIW
eukprot:CAMPEP_0204872810 /NCGR_PEP_ID=MMETSP1348-20121228/38940_1 /ASSEMBLY_ACC=CAM_ASM_000700 /TAXON_ID=215587 /ORGANISM="Aplanochytrium stocchinoi, Strain GSBS06" /LENGTH=289 /DNA_ID=CAMNT_0052027825 /DNA_START=334 /DNA_END=1200 /DNA_ORIENTATION=-